jgi:thiol-disulfide isomerase/thioredoxin
MNIWEILIVLLLIITTGLTAFLIYRIYKIKKRLSYTKQFIGLSVKDLIPSSIKTSPSISTINIPKKGKVILFFHGPNCKLCKKQEEELKKIYKAKILKLDIRTKRGKTLAGLFRVSALPTVIVIKNWVIKGYFTPFATEGQIKKVLE